MNDQPALDFDDQPQPAPPETLYKVILDSGLVITYNRLKL